MMQRYIIAALFITNSLCAMEQPPTETGLTVYAIPGQTGLSKLS